MLPEPLLLAHTPFNVSINRNMQVKSDLHTAGVLELSLQDFLRENRHGEDIPRRSHWSLLTPLSCYPSTYLGVRTCLRYANWLPSTAEENGQESRWHASK